MSDKELSSGWAEANLAEVVEQDAPILYGILQPGPNLDDGVPYVRPTEISNDKIRLNDLRKTSENISAKYGRSTLKEGDLVMSMVGTIGKVAMVPESLEGGNITQSSVRIRAESSIIDRYYLAWFLRSPLMFRQFGASRLGTAVPRLNVGDIRLLKLSIPPLAEQKRIVAKIEELFSELDAGEESLRRARRQLGVYRQSLLKQAFEGKLTAPWRAQNPDLLESPDQLLTRIQEERRERPNIEALPKSWLPCWVGEFVSIERGRFSVRPRNDPRYYDGDIPFVQIGDLPGDGGSINSYKQTLNQAGLEVSKKFKKGTPLIAIVGATIGNTGILAFDACCPDSLVALVSEDPISAKFVELYFRSNKDRIRNDSYSSGGQPNINNAYLNRQCIGVPSLPEQQEIVRLLDEQFEVIEQNEREIDAALKRSEALRQSILKKAFTGQLVPQDPTDEPASIFLERIRKGRAKAIAKPAKKRTRNKARS